MFKKRDVNLFLTFLIHSRYSKLGIFNDSIGFFYDIFKPYL